MIPQKWEKNDKLELYRQCPSRIVKDTHMTELEKWKCVSYIMTIAPVWKIDREKMGAMGILQVIYNGVYVCICNVYSSDFKEVTQHSFVYDSHFSTKEKSEFCGVIIDNRSYSPIYVLERKI